MHVLEQMGYIQKDCVIIPEGGEELQDFRLDGGRPDLKPSVWCQCETCMIVPQQSGWCYQLDAAYFYNS